MSFRIRQLVDTWEIVDRVNAKIQSRIALSEKRSPRRAFISKGNLSVKINKKSWNDVSNDDMSIEAIKKLHLPTENYRFSKNGYERGAHFIGTKSIPYVIYVLEGSIIYTIDGIAFQLNGGEVGELDRCDYVCDVPSAKDVKFISVFHLPEKLRKVPE